VSPRRTLARTGAHRGSAIGSRYCEGMTQRSAEPNSKVGGKLMHVLNGNGWRLGWSNGMVRCGNRSRLQEPLETGGREHDQVVIFAIAGIAQLVGNVARGEESIAAPENKMTSSSPTRTKYASSSRVWI
jgi:hypothetical protein